MVGTDEFRKIATHALSLRNDASNIFFEIKLSDLYSEKQKKKYMRDIYAFAKDMNELMEDYIKRGHMYE